MSDIATTTPPAVELNDLKAAVALELAIQIIPTKDVIKRFNLSVAKLREMMKDTGFKNMIKQFRADWEAADNVRERVRLKAGVALEDSLINLYTIANDLDTTPAARIDAIKQMANLADVTPRKEGGGSESKFSVVINLPNSEPMTIETPVIEGNFIEEE